ncbi:MAG: hypothetical protein N4A48_08850 [Tepidibacter sp.]|jgi:type III secretion system FlhB-like substrate exporter|nr:hypothetical protein [Tepidibacter sp.]MCT4508855.1 hypothetical protein [Tepidibacter sp.]
MDEQKLKSDNDLNEDIPEELIDIVSKVLLFVENIDERRSKKG